MFSRGKVPRGIYVELESQHVLTWQSSTWHLRGRQHGFKLESVRLGLLKVKPSLRDSILESLQPCPLSCLVMSVR